MHKFKKYLAFIFGVIFIAAISYAYFAAWTGAWPYPSEIKILDKGKQFTDRFSAFSALVSALGFFGILITLFFQQSQIAQQSKELMRQAKRDEETRQRAEIDQYEHFLFRLLDYYKESIESIRLKRRGIESRGRDCLRAMLNQMQTELRRRKLNFIHEREFTPIKQGTATQEQLMLLKYVIMETCRVIQYTVTYQHRVIATITALLYHLENRCPEPEKIQKYRSLVFSQITHIEIQYIFAITLAFKNEQELRQLIQKSCIFSQNSAPYNFKLH